MTAYWWLAIPAVVVLVGVFVVPRYKAWREGKHLEGLMRQTVREHLRWRENVTPWDVDRNTKGLQVGGGKGA